MCTDMQTAANTIAMSRDMFAVIRGNGKRTRVNKTVGKQCPLRIL